MNGFVDHSNRIRYDSCLIYGLYIPFLRSSNEKRFLVVMVFDSESARAAAKKRKHRFATVTTLAKAAAKSKKANKTRTTRTVARMNVAFRNNTGSGGANSAMTPGAVEAALDALSEERPMTKKSVLVDFGCGSGNLLVAAVMRYGVKAYGIEKDDTAFRAAVTSVKKISCQNVLLY